MAGRGPLPKEPWTRVRRNRSPELRVVECETAPQPDLPDCMSWPAETVAWWRRWGESQLSHGFTELDWSELLDAALLHRDLWRGNLKVASELRLRVGKFGATPEDRARLRIKLVPPPSDEPPHHVARWEDYRNL